MGEASLQRLAAFATRPGGGNPAGVWIGDELPDAATMQRIAAEVGYSETIFLAPGSGKRRTVRYYSPEAEVSFCGHATIAAGAALGDACGEGVYWLETLVGAVPVEVCHRNGRYSAALTSAEPQHRAVDAELLQSVLGLLGHEAAELDFSVPPAQAYAGVWHIILAFKEGASLAELDYDFEALKQLMLAHNLTTLQLVWRESEKVFHARNPFPVGGVVEDPATGAAAAALGGYLRDAGLIVPPVRLQIHQGVAMGRPSLLTVEVPERGGVKVSGDTLWLE